MMKRLNLTEKCKPCLLSLSLLAQPFLGGQAVLPQSHAGATIAKPQLQAFHCVMNTSRNKL